VSADRKTIRALALRWGELRGAALGANAFDLIKMLDEQHIESLKYAEARGEDEESAWRGDIAWAEERLRDQGIDVPEDPETRRAAYAAALAVEVGRCRLPEEQLTALLIASDPHTATMILGLLKDREPAERRRMLVEHLIGLSRGDSQEAQRLRAALGAEPAPVSNFETVPTVGTEPELGTERLHHVDTAAPPPAPEAEGVDGPPPIEPQQPRPPDLRKPLPQRDLELARWINHVLDELGPLLPPSVMVSYLICLRLADWNTERKFFLSDEELAKRLGKDERTARKALKMLRAAGVIKRRKKGYRITKTGKARASVYQLEPLTLVTRERMSAGLISQWWAKNPRMLQQAERDELADSGGQE
jgi:biotin operon repressor